MKSRNQIENEINSYIITNNAQQITAVQVNQILNDINDSTYNKLTDTSISGLSNFATASSYSSGNSVIYDGYIWNANVSTGPGPFTQASWTRIQKLKVTGTRAEFLALASSSSLIPGSMYHIQPGVVDIFIWAISVSAFSPIAYNLLTGQSGLYDINTNTFTQFATAIAGPTGSQGSTGPQGNTGSQGFTGPQGNTGAGVQGPTGVQGFTGPQGATGAKGATGAAGPGGDISYYAVFYDTNDQTNASAFGTNIINFGIDGGSNGISNSTGTNLYFDYAGTYKISFSLQFSKDDSGQDTLNTWLRLNGNTLDYTNRIYTLEQLNSNQRIQSDYIVTVTAGSNIQICWSSDDFQMKLTALGTQSSPDRPITTSAYVDIHKIIYSGYEGIPGSPGFFLIAYSNTTQTNPIANTARYMTFSTVENSQGINLLNNRQIQVDYTGVYNIQFSAQLDKTDAGDDNVDIWFRKNGVNIPYSNTTVMVHSANGKSVPSWNYMDYLTGGDYVEIMWSSPDTSMRILAEGTQSSPDRPEIPSIILTVQQVQYQNEAGATGVQGHTGPQGPTGVGVQGNTGPQGNTGVQGFTGPQGSTGNQGFTGPQGNQGVTGPQGNRGFQGFTGPQGFQGLTGPQGFTGPQGATGLQGATGPAGASGDAGTQGPTGPAGASGGAGTQGPTGPAGASGGAGPQGATGPAGASGGAGTQGPTGPAGGGGDMFLGLTQTVTGSKTFAIPGASGSSIIFSGAGTSSTAQLAFTGTLMNWIDMSTIGLAAPTALVARSVGTRIVLNKTFVAGSNTDYAIGANSGEMWMSVASSGGAFGFYQGISTGAGNQRLSSIGNNGLTVQGLGTSTIGNIQMAPYRDTAGTDYNWINFGVYFRQLGPPTFATSRSIGTRISLYSTFANGTTADAAIGVDTNDIWIGTPTATTTISMYAGTTRVAFFGGAVGTSLTLAGTLVNNGSVNLRAGTIAAGTAPIYFNTTGPALLTTPVNGAVEYNNTDLFITANSTRQTILKGKSGNYTTTATASTDFVITFGGTQPNSTYEVAITPTALLTAAQFYISAKTTTTFTVTYLSALTGTASFDWLLVQ